jgi:hypothetical protein
MADDSILQRIKDAIKQSTGDVAAERFGSVGRYVNSRLNDQKPESFREILKRDIKAGATKNFGSIGRAIAGDSKSLKKNDALTSSAIRNSSNRLSSEIDEIKQQNSSIGQSLESVNYRLKRVDAKLEDILLSQERIEIVVNRLLYKKEPPPVIDQTVNNVTNNITNNITNNNTPGIGGGGRGRGGGRGGATPNTPGGGATPNTPGGGATPRSLNPAAALGLGAAGGAAVGAAVGASSAGSSGPGSGGTGPAQGPAATQSQTTSGVTPNSGPTSASTSGNNGGRPYQQDARPVSGNAATQEAMQFFQSKGWTREQAAGIVGNLQVESGNFAPDVVSGRRKGDGGKAVGIAQWHPPRQATFQRVMGKPVEGSSLKEQLEFVNWELNNTEKRAGNILRTMTDAAQAAEAVDKFYERSSGAHRTQRVANARSLAGGQNASSTPAQPSGTTPSQSASGNTTSPTVENSTGASGGEAQWWRQTPRNEAGVPTQTMSGVLPEYPSQTRGGGADTQAMYSQDRATVQPWQGRPDRQQQGGQGGQQQGGMTTLKTASGKSYTVASQYADKFKGFVDALEATGYRINSIGGYANRTTASGGFSWHSKGMAIDINPSQNPHTFPGSQNYGKTDMPSNVSELAARFGLGWGGNWRSSKDTMHFSAGGNEGGSGTEARGGTMASAGENESRPGSSTGGQSSSPMPGGRVAGITPTGSPLGAYGGMGVGGMTGMPGMMSSMRGAGGGLGGVGGMIGGMLGGRAGGPAGGFIGSILGSVIGNVAQQAIVQSPVRTGSDLNRRSTETAASSSRPQQRSSVINPQGPPAHTTPSLRRFGVDEIPSVSPVGGFAEVLGAGVAGALVEALGSNSISVNRRQRVGSLVS